MKNLTILFLLLTLSTFSATARLFSVRATLNATHVTPPNPPIYNPVTQTGTLTGTLDDVTGLLTYSITYSPCAPQIRFHSGAAGTNGPQIFSPSSNCNPPTNGTFTLTATDITNLLVGNIYVELDYSSVKIRGQLTSVLIIDTFNNAAQNNFYGIGGYSYTQTTFPNGVQANPYIVSGPSPQNDFSYGVSAVGGITNRAGYITATNTNTPLTIQFYGNNIRKFGCRTDGIDIAVANITTDVIRLTATTNLGAVATQTSVNGSRFVGFNVMGENEYLVSVTIQFNSTPSPAAYLSMQNIILGDNTPQNVALNFDGSNDYVSIPSAVGNFATNQDFTVSCWIKPDPNQPTPSGQFYSYDNDIITKRNDQSASISDPYPFEIRYLNVNYPVVTDRHKIKVGQWDGTTFKEVTSATAVNDGKWHHVAFVRTGGNSGVFKLYIDGVQEGSNVTDNANNNTTNIHPLQIGRKVNNQNFFKGEIDEVRIWSFGKTATEIANERFCKTPNATNLVVAYNFSNGVPHDNNSLITQVQDAVGTNHGTLNNFAKTGDASNFVTGQVKYVNNDDAGNNNGSSWTNVFPSLQIALTANTCNDLFDVYVAKGNASYKPAFSDVNISFNIPTGMRIYGGFAGTEKSINHRNLALIRTTNETTLSGDLSINDSDIPFNFTTNRTDNSQNVVVINGSNAVIDGFTIRGSRNYGVSINSGITNTLFKHNKVIDNRTGIEVRGNNTIIANSIISGNQFTGVDAFNVTPLNINNSLLANNGSDGVFISVTDGTTKLKTITNNTIAFNAGKGIDFNIIGSTSTNTIKNNLIYGNVSGGIAGNSTNTITYSLVQGVTTGTGNLNGNTVNPQFVSPLGSGFGSLSLANMGDYRLKDSSPCINVGDDVGVSPLDLDRNPRPKGGKTDMGAYESNVNMNEIISIINGNWESSSTWNLKRQPLATDKVILNGHNVMIGTNLARAKDLEYKTGAILRYVNGGLLRFGL